MGVFKTIKPLVAAGISRPYDAAVGLCLFFNIGRPGYDPYVYGRLELLAGFKPA